MSKPISDSRFYMWRTLFAVAHADNVVTDEEIEFMAHILEDVNFTDKQTDILKDDIVNPKNVELMFQGVTELNDRIEFFDFARDLVWVDGDFGSQEQSVMIKLQQEHMKRINVEDMMGNISLQLEDDAPDNKHNYSAQNDSSNEGLYGVLKKFYRKFGGE